MKHTHLVAPANVHCVQVVQRLSLAPASKPGEKSPPAVGWDVSGEPDALRHEQEAVKRRQHALEEEVARLQSALNRKNRECQEVAQSRDAIQKQADQQIQELEEALGDVQKRMLDSECKVKQLQAHVVAVKEHLGGQGVEDLRAQLQDVKVKYEGASAEVGRVRNRLKQSEKALEEYKNSENQLAAEAERLGQDLEAVAAERDELAEVLVEMEAKLKEADATHGHTVPAEKFDNMKNLLTNAVDEKERQLAELREDYDRVLEEVADLNRQVDSPSSQRGSGEASAEEQRRLRATLEEQNQSLKQTLAELTAKSQDLIREVREGKEEQNVLREQLSEFRSRVEMDFIPVRDYEEARRNAAKAREELEDKLVEASERYGKAEAQVQQLQTERTQLQEDIGSISSSSRTHQSQADELRSQNGDLLRKVELMQSRSEGGEKERVQLTARIHALEESLAGEHVPKQQHESVKAELSSALESARAEASKVANEKKAREEELKKVKDGNDKLKEELEKVSQEMKKDRMHVRDHKDATERLNTSVVEAEAKVKEVTGLYLSAQEERAKLTRELEAQRKELDTIQEAIQSKFISVAAAEERQKSYVLQVEELNSKLAEAEAKYNKERSAGQNKKEEQEKLRVEMESVQQRLDSALVSRERLRDEEEEFRSRCEQLTHQVSSLEQQHQQSLLQKAELQDQNALLKSQNQSLQERLKSELTRIATYDTELKALHDAMQQAQTDCKKAREARQEEAQKVCGLQKELQEHRREQASQAQSQERLQAQISTLQLALREEEENGAQRAEDVSALQSELLQATQALEKLRHQEEQVNQLRKEKQELQKELAELGGKLLRLAGECEEARQEAARARESEGRVRAELEAVQEKGSTVEGEIGELKKRYDQSLSTIGDLQRRIQTSAQQTEAKDKKVVESLFSLACDG